MAQADIAQTGRVHRPAMRHGSLSVTELYSWPSVQSKGLIFLSAATQSSQFLFVRSKAATWIQTSGEAGHFWGWSFETGVLSRKKFQIPERRGFCWLGISESFTFWWCLAQQEKYMSPISRRDPASCKDTPPPPPMLCSLPGFSWGLSICDRRRFRSMWPRDIWISRGRLRETWKGYSEQAALIYCFTVALTVRKERIISLGLAEEKWDLVLIS